MSFTCALSTEQIDNLYQDAYKIMKNAADNNEKFLPHQYMQDLFNGISKRTDAATAAKFIQVVPSLIQTASLRENLRTLDLDANVARKYAIEFENVENGISNVLKKFQKIQSSEELANAVKDKKKNDLKPDTVESSETLNELTEIRLKPFSALSTTMQEFDPKDPKEKTTYTIELLNVDRKRIFATIRSISDSLPNDYVPGVSDLVYDGRVIKLRPMRLVDMDPSQLDEHTRAKIGQGLGIKKQGSGVEGVLPIDKRIALVITDANGTPLKFDVDGKISTEEDAKQVYQFTRTVRKVGDRYTAMGVYNLESQVLESEVIAYKIQKNSGLSVEAFEEREGKSMQELTKEVDQAQQKDLADLYKFKKDFLVTPSKVITIPFAGLNKGNIFISGGPEITLSTLAKSTPKTELLQIYNTLSPNTTEVAGQKKGWSTIIIDENKISVDRPHISQEIASKIAEVILSDLPAKSKNAYIDQFISKDIKGSNYEIIYDPKKNIYTFGISEPRTPIEKVDNTWSTSKISDLLMKGVLSPDGKTPYANRMHIRHKLVNGGYFDFQNGELVEADYIDDVLSKSDAKLKVGFTEQYELFNANMQFTIPSNSTEEIKKANDKLEPQLFISEVRKDKDKAVEALKALPTEDKSMTVSVQPDSVRRGVNTLPGFEGETYNNFVIQYGENLFADAEISKEFKKDGVLVESLFPKKGDIVTIKLEDSVVDKDLSGKELPEQDKLYITDIVSVYVNGKYVGYLKETDYPKEQSRTAEYKKQYKELKALKQEAEVQQKINPENTSNPSDGNWTDAFGMDRKSSLPQGVTQADIDNADEWWKGSELNKFISLGHMANIVNSDAFAKFIVNGTTILNDGKLANIQINKHIGGNMVDVYHEAWHGFSQLFLTKPEKTALYNEIIALGGKYADMSFKQIEEELAEDFRTYAKNQKTKENRPERNSLFRRILNFLKKFLGLTTKKDVAMNLYEVPSVKALYDALYLSDKNPGLLNKYTPLIDNVMFDELNRGVRQFNNPKEDALNTQDSDQVVGTMDNILAEIIDDYFDMQSKQSQVDGNTSKAGTIQLVSQMINAKGTRNRDALMARIKVKLEERLEERRNELGSTTVTPFSDIDSLSELKKNAVATMVHKEGDHKYIFLKSQIDSFNTLALNSKKGDRVKGETYNGIDIIGDFYTHESQHIRTKEGGRVGILVVDTLEDGVTQFDNYMKGGATAYSLEKNDNPPATRTLTDKEQKLQDDIRVLEITTKNMLFKNTVVGDKTVAVPDYSKGVFQYYKEHSDYKLINEKAISTEDALDEESDKNGDGTEEADFVTREKLGNSITGDKSLEELGSDSVSFILKTLFKIVDGNKVKDRLGFYERADFSTVWNNVTRAIGGIEDPKEMYEALKDKARQESFPELKQLVNKRLPEPTLKSKSSPEFDITTDFWQTFKRKRTSYIQASTTKDGEIIITKSRFETDVLARSFSTDFKTATPETNNYITRIDNKTRLDFNAVLQKFTDKKVKSGPLDIALSIEFARALGIPLDDLIIIKKELKLRSEYYGLPFMFDAIKDIAAKEKELKAKDSLTNADTTILNTIERFKLDPVGMFRNINGISADVLGRSKGVQERTQIERIAILHGSYGVKYANFSVLNAEGSKVFEHIDDSTASRKIYALNKAKKLTDLWVKDKNGGHAFPEFQHMSYLDFDVSTFTKRSQILRHLFNYNDPEFSKKLGKSLEFANVSGTQDIDTREGTNTTSLDYNGKFLQEMNMMLMSGLQEFIRHGSKGSSFGMAARGGVTGQVGVEDSNFLYVDTESLRPEGDGDTYVFDKVLLPYIFSEHERTVKFKSNLDVFKTYKGYNKKVRNNVDGKMVMAGSIFTAFDDMLSPTLKGELYNIENLEEHLKTNPDLKARIKQDVQTYFAIKTSKTLELLTENGYVDAKLSNKLKVYDLDTNQINETLSKSYTYNSWIHNFETIGLLYGDMAQFNHAKDELHKRNSGLSSTGLGMRTDVYARDFITSVFSQSSYATKLNETNPNTPYKNIKYDGTFNTAITKDITRKSIYLNDIEAAWRKDYKVRFKDAKAEDLKGALTTKELAKLGKNPTKANLRDAYIDKKVNADIKEYAKMNEADGQGLITIDAYRTLKKLSGQWGPEQDVLFKKIIEGKEISIDDVKEFFPVYKVQYFGELADTLLPVTGMHKFSLMPLIPSMIKNSDMEALHKRMMEKDIQYMTFESGSKVGSILDENGQPDQLYLEGSAEKSFNDKMDFTNNKIYLEYLKDVTAVPSSFKTKTISATQLRKIILSDLYAGGVPIDPSHVDALKEYNDSIDDYSEALQMEILEDIGYKKDKEGNLVGNLGQFLAVVQKQLGLKDVPEHLIRFVGVTEDNQLKTDLSYHLEADTVEKILLSLFEKKLIKQKVKGEALVQVSSTMTNGIWDKSLKENYPQEFSGNEESWTAEQRKIAQAFIGSNNLPFYHQVDGKTKLMKIAIAFQGDFANLLNLNDLDGNKIETRERLNELIKNDKWLDKDNNRKAITLTGVRIPTQTLGFIEAMEVYEFLDPAAGGIIILPSEIVVKNGSDFDVDKMTAYMPNINGNGEYIQYDPKFDNARLKEHVNQLRESGKLKEIKQVIRNQKMALENRLIESIKTIVELPENFSALVKPTGTQDLKEIADELARYMSKYDKFEVVHGETRVDEDGNKVISSSRPLEIQHNLMKHSVNLEGKDVLGIAANEDALHQVLNQAGAKMPAKYKAQVRVNGKYVDTTIEYDMRLNLPHNTKDGRISLSDINTQDGLYRISDLISQAMNGLVDVEKDEWVFWIQANLELATTLFYLLKAGVSPRDAIYFLANPMISSYVNNLKKINGAYAKLTGKAVDKAAYAPYQAVSATLSEHYTEIEQQDLLNNVNKLKLEAIVKNTTKQVAVEYQERNKSGSLGPKKTVIVEPAQLKKLVGSDIYVNRIIANTGAATGTEIFKATGGLGTRSNYYYSASLTNNKSVLNKDGNFAREQMLNLIKDGVNADNRDLALAGFLHFIEIENQTKGLQKLKRLSKPDTARTKTVQEIVSRQNALEELMVDSTVDPELVKAITKESVLKSFYIGDLIKGLVNPLFKLRNNDTITDYILRQSKSESVKAVFGGDSEGISQYIRSYKNAVVNSIFQNQLSNFTDEKGRVVDYPKEYRELAVKVSTEDNAALQKYGAVVNVEDGSITINPAVIMRDYENQNYLKSAEGENAYTARGLESFDEKDNPFSRKVKVAKEQAIYYDLESSFFKYVIEREFLRSKNPNASEEFLAKRALTNSFNYYYLTKMDQYSYADDVIATINKYDHLKIKYPILNQITLVDSIKGDKILTLSDAEKVKNGLATTYYHNLKELADPNIKKLTNPAANLELSKMFRMFPLVALYQHGIGYSKHGFNSALPYDNFLGIVQDSGNNFVQHQMSDDVLNIINNRMLSSDPYKNYVVSAKQIDKSAKPDREGTMFFNYGQWSRPEVKSTTTFDAVLNSERTSTTRWMTQGGVTNKAYSYWSGTKVGDIIKWWEGDNKTGRNVLVQVTSTNTVNLNTMTDEALEEWSKSEGWSVDYAKKVKIDQTKSQSDLIGIQIKYRLLDPSSSSESVPDPDGEQGSITEFPKKNLFTVTVPAGISDAKAVAKASIATQFIGFGKDIVGKDGRPSTTQTYKIQAGEFANTGNYNSDDVIFVSIPGNRGDATLRKMAQDNTIKEAIKAIEAGATLLTDDEAYLATDEYNSGERRLAKNLEAKGFIYSETVVDGVTIGVWNKATQPSISVINIYSTDNNGFKNLSNLLNGPVKATVNGVERTFKTVEHLYQIKKALFARDTEIANKIFAATTGFDAQKLAKTIKNLDSSAWDKISSQELESAMRLAFKQNQSAKNLLLSTGTAKLTHKTKFNLGKWETIFPEILMKIRDELKPTVQPVGEVKEGVVELFEAKPNLSQIGTPQQYSEWITYLTTQGKLAGTQSTNMLYHGSDQEFDTFDKTKRGSATGDGYFPDQTPIDSLNAFFFSTDDAVSIQYGLLIRIQQIQNIAILLGYGRMAPERYKNLKKYSPELSQHLKEKQTELNKEDFIKYLNEITKKYRRANDELGTGFLNMYKGVTDLNKQLIDLKNRKKEILSGTYIHNSFILDYPKASIIGYNTKGAKELSINNKGIIMSSYHKNFNQKDITKLTSKEYDELMSIMQSYYNLSLNKINSILKKTKITPILYRVLLNVQKPLVKDFEGKTFVNQAYEAGAQYEASKLTNKAAKSKGEYDSVIFKNILDPYMSDNYGVFEPEQVYILGGTEDTELFKEFVSTQPSTKQTAEVELVKEEAPGTTEFAYKGTEIDTGFTLGQQQTDALTQSIDHVLDKTGETVFTIQGSAGTGKTTIIGLLNKYMDKHSNNYSFEYLSPTHAANIQLAFANLKNGITKYPSTIQSSLIFDKKESAWKIKDKLVPTFTKPVYVLDEASMLNQAKADQFKRAVQAVGGKIIYLGDIAQIPSPDNSTGRFTSIFTSEPKIVLDKVYRQNPNDLLNVLTNIRTNNDLITYYVENSDGSIQFMPGEEYYDSMIEDFKANPTETMYIAYTRKAVSDINKKVKQSLTGSQYMQTGDKIVGYAGAMNKSPKDNSLANSVNYMITDVKVETSRGTRILQITSEAKILTQLKDKNVRGLKSTPRTNYVQLNHNDSIEVEGITDEELEANNKMLSDNMAHSVNDYINALNDLKSGYSATKWAIMLDAKNSILGQFQNHDLGGDYVFNIETNRLEPFDYQRHSNLYSDMTKYPKDLLSNLTIEKGVDYGYGITAHKSQGMTVSNVYIDVKNIKEAGIDTPMFDSFNNKVNTEKNMLYYVAMSRASGKTVINTTGIKFDKTVIGKGVQAEEIKVNKEEFIEEYPAISEFYNSLTPEQKKILGTLDELAANLEEMPFHYSEEEYIEFLKKCKL